MPANKLSNLWSETLKILNKARSKGTYFDIRVADDDNLKVFQVIKGVETELFDFHTTGEEGDITSVSAGVGLSGGGTTGEVSLALDASELTALGTAPASGDFIVVQDISDNSTKKVTVSNLTSTIDADITSVIAGAGMTGGATEGAATLNVIAGTGITVNADDIQTNDSQIVHDNLSGFVANEHIDHSGVTLTAGNGLTGGGDITAGRTFAVGAGTGITVNANDVQTNDSEIVHDNLSGFVANEHIDHSSVSITAGTGLSGGGDLTSTRTLSVDLSELTDMTQTINSAQDELILLDNGSDRRKLISEIPLSAFDNDSGFTTTAGTVTNVTVGTGLDVSSGTTTPFISLDLSELTDMTSDVNSVNDEIILLDNGQERRKRFDEIGVSNFDNDAGYQTSAGSVASATNATNATNVTTTTDSGNAVHYITFADSTSATQQLKTDNGIQYNPSTNTLTTVKLQATSEVEVYDGATSSDTIVKMYDSNDDGVIDVYQNDSVKARIHGNGDSYFTGGDLGVGTSSPAAKLHVSRNATVGGIGGLTLGNAGVKITDSSANMYLDGNSINTDNLTYINVSTNHDFILATNDSERMRIKNNGLVGIGTDSPNAGLHIDISGEPQLLLDGGDNSHGDLVVPDGEIMQIGHWNNGTDTFTGRITMDTDGDIGFGVASPDSRLHINCGTTNTAKEDGIRLAADNDDWYIFPKRIGGSSTNVNLQFNADGNDYAFIDDGGSNDLLNFTGQHRCLADSSTDFAALSASVGKIVVSSGKYDNPNKESDITINESIPTVKLSNKRNQKSVFGVVSNAEDPDQQDRTYNFGAFGTNRQKKSPDDVRIHINSLGEGAIWVCNTNGALENGDYITTCEIPGYGMKQDSEMLCNYTVAKITMDCNFDLNAENYECVEVEHDGEVYRAAFVGCTYHCG